MKTGLFDPTLALVGAVVMCIGLNNLSSSAVGAHAEGAKATAPQVVLAETYNAVTRIYFKNTAVHKGSHKPGLVERRFRADGKYWLMDAKYYERGELSVGNPPLVDLVRKLGSKNLPESEPTTLSAMAYENRARRSGAISYYAADRSSSDTFLEGAREQGRSRRQPCREPGLAALKIEK